MTMAEIRLQPIILLLSGLLIALDAFQQSGDQPPYYLVEKGRRPNRQLRKRKKGESSTVVDPTKGGKKNGSQTFSPTDLPTDLPTIVPSEEPPIGRAPPLGEGFWVQRGFDIDGEAPLDVSGYAVDLSSDGRILAIGAYGNDGNAGVDSGQVRVYEYSSGGWTQRGRDIDGEAKGDFSGVAVALSSDGTVLAVGAENNFFKSGQVRIYVWSGVDWVQRGADIDGETIGDVFGTSVALSGDGTVVAIGASDNDGINGVDSGHVRVFWWSGSLWKQLGPDIDGEAAFDYSGTSVALSHDGTILAIGAPENDNTGGSEAGHVRVYQWTGTFWIQGTLDIDGETPIDFSGDSVALSGNGRVLAIGADGKDGVNGVNSGQVRVFEASTTFGWIQRGNDIDGEKAEDYSGWSVALSGAGDVLAVGAYGNNLHSGQVRVYQWTEGAWVQSGPDLNGEFIGDEFGDSVALSYDGTILAVGAGSNSDKGEKAGSVKVYEWYRTKSNTPPDLLNVTITKVQEPETIVNPIMNPDSATDPVAQPSPLTDSYALTNPVPLTYPVPATDSVSVTEPLSMTEAFTNPVAKTDAVPVLSTATLSPVSSFSSPESILLLSRERRKRIVEGK